MGFKCEQLKKFTSLPQLLARRAELNGARVFLSSPEEKFSWSYAETYRLALTVTEQLRDAGVGHGQRVAVVMGNSPAWAVVFLGVLLAGASAVPLNPELTDVELKKILALSGAGAVVMNKNSALTVTENRPRRFWVGGEEIGARVFSRGRWEIFTGAADHDEALLLFTSGSTGTPKGVVLSHENLLAEAGFIRDGHRLTVSDTVLCVLPFFHINGLVITLISTALAGGRAVVPRKFSASNFWRWIADSHATWFSAAPTILSILLSRPRDRALDISALLTVTILKKFENTFGVPVIEAYGLSEIGSQVATNPLPPKKRKAGSVGLPAGNELIVVDGHFNPLPVSVSGEVAVRGPSVSVGYWQNIAENEKVFATAGSSPATSVTLTRTVIYF
jgi:acyl-CoA synthetase (AMP-forming)/AMP-acid ligase II